MFLYLGQKQTWCYQRTMIGETFPGQSTDYKDKYEHKDSVTSFHATVDYWELFTAVANQLNFENLLFINTLIK